MEALGSVRPKAKPKLPLGKIPKKENVINSNPIPQANATVIAKPEVEIAPQPPIETKTESNNVLDLSTSASTVPEPLVNSTKTESLAEPINEETNVLANINNRVKKSCPITNNQTWQFYSNLITQKLKENKFPNLNQRFLFVIDLRQNEKS